MPWRAEGNWEWVQREDLGQFYLQPYCLGFFTVVIIIIIAVLGIEPRVSMHARQAFYL